MNMAPNIALVNTEAAVSLIQGTQRDSQMKAWLGDPSQFEHNTEISGAINSAHSALRSGAETITALTGDATRSDPERHAVGGEVSARTVAKLEEVQQRLKANADAYAQAANQALKERFALKSENAWLNDKWLGFVRETYAKEGGPATIRETMLQHRDLATLMVKMPTPLLGIPEKQHQEWRVKAVEKFEPEIQSGLQMAEDIRDVASRYTRIVGMVRLNFHSQGIAAKVATRVRLT
ncbi:hypothetical protein [Blastomonas sp.]|uniref:hypothetical protein n=1 Tax=Blastomonas sp. TaxID=1909299 RepID=UPI002607F96D|nr:hypothetical protein [Blastomonas sp.]MDM7956601.1 hypothetical protein [Blastomonas sp.]